MVRQHVPSFSPLLLCGSCTVRDEFAYKGLLQVLDGKVLRFWRQSLSRHGRVCVWGGRGVPAGCAQPGHLGWPPGSGLQEHEKGSLGGPVELHLRPHCL